MKNSRRAGSIYTTSNSNRKSQASLKLINSRYKQNLPISQQYERTCDAKYQRHFDNQSLQRKLDKRKAQRNRSSGQIMRRSLAQTTNFNYADRERKPQVKYQYQNANKDYQTTIQRLKQQIPRNRHYQQDYSSKGILLNQSCNTKKNTLALTSILNYNFNGQMMNKTAQLRTNYDYSKKSEVSNNTHHCENLKNTYHCEELKEQKIKNFQQRYNAILFSYQRRKRQLSQEFNKTQTKNPIRAKSISAKIKQDQSHPELKNFKPFDQNQQTKHLSKLNPSNSPYQKSLLSKTTKVPIENIIQSKLDKIGLIQKDMNAKITTDRQKVKAKIKTNNAHEQFRQFFKVLEQHVSYQEKLRNIKHEIENHSKANEIASNLALKGIAKQELKLSSEQYDPFQSARTENNKSQSQISNIVEQYCSYRVKCEENWRGKFVNMWNQQTIKRLFEKLDYSKKTQLSLKQFVREFNCLTNKTLKIRDLYKISERLKPMTKANFVKRLSKIEI